MSKKMKITTAIILAVVLVALIVVLVVVLTDKEDDGDHTINGSISFNVGDNGLNLDSVSYRSGYNTSIPLTLASYTQGNMNMAKVNINNLPYEDKSFVLYFTVTNTSTNIYDVQPETTLNANLEGVTVSASGKIDSGETTTIELYITSTRSKSIDLGNAIIAISKNYTDLGYTFLLNMLTDYTGSASEVVIPSTYKTDASGNYIEDLDGSGTSVASISYGVFSGNQTLTSVTIPSTVTSIKDRAFASCTSLHTVNFETNSHLLTIGSGAFRSCTSLTTVTIPSTVTSIGGGAFASCSSLQTVNFETNSRLETIGNRAFQYCTSLTDITLPSTVTSIGDEIFDNCINLQRADISNCKITSIPVSAFDRCSSLTSITIPSTVTSIGDYAFRYCYALAIVYNRSNLTITAGDYASAAGYYAKEVVTSGQAVGEIITENQIQYYVNETTGDKIALAPSVLRDSLTSVILASDTTAVNQNAFVECPNLIYTYSGEAMYLGSADNEYYALIGTNVDTITSIQIHQNCNIIADYAFYDKSNLQTVYFGENSQVQRIGRNAFASCQNLQVVDFGANSQLKIIAENAFHSCRALTTITIPATVTNIGEDVFVNCSQLATVIIDSQYVYTSETDRYSSGNLLRNATTVKVPTSIVNAYDNAYLESASFSTSSESINGVAYTVFTRVA